MTKHQLPHQTREGWLRHVSEMLIHDFFTDKGYDFPEKWHVSCGFPKGHGGKAIGQCWDPTVAADGTVHIFICPSQDEPTRVADILLHELIHAAVGIEEGHKGMFRKLAKEFELEGKMTATYVTPGTPLHDKLVILTGKAGAYPHKKMVAPKRAGKSTNNWVRYESQTEEGYRVMVSPKQVDEFGPPLDPWGEAMVPVKKGK